MTTCTPTSLLSAIDQFLGGPNVTHKQLLTALIMVLCKINGMKCDVSTLAKQAQCLACGMSEKQLLAAAVSILCTQGASSTQIVEYFTTGPTADGVFPANRSASAIAVKYQSTTFTWSPELQKWDDV